MSEKLFNPLKITSITVTWEVENIWNLSFDGASSATFLLLDRIFHLNVRRYELSIAIYLCRDDTIPSSLPLLCKLCMIDQIGQEKLIGDKEILIDRGKEFVLIGSVNIGDLERQKREFLADDRLVLSCNLSASYRVSLGRNSELAAEANIECFEALSSDFENFYKEQKSSDASLIVDGTEFRVHRAVLCARASVLASIIHPESPKNEDLLLGIESTTFCNILYYIYTGKVRGLTSKTAVKMFAAASKFSLLELKSICLKFLQSHLSEDNIFDVAVLAYENGDLMLKEEVEQYIVSKIATILETEKWKEFCAERSKFSNEILTAVLLRMKKKC